MASDEAARRARVEAAEAKARAKALRPWFKKKRFIVPLVLVALVALGSTVDDAEDSAAAGRGGPRSGPGIETSSRNAANPPPDDLNDDFECDIDSLLGVTGRGTLTNRTSQTSSYIITVVMEVDGVRYGDGVALINDVRSGATVEWEAPSLTRWREGSSCTVQEVDRFAS